MELMNISPKIKMKDLMKQPEFGNVGNFFYYYWNRN